ncbi:MAG: hypothetical protein IPM51_05695 [Sphingobacteriaceae bacterium]|nr:hypothetical protein [Sphingobacteriaceae bacterium]
MKVSKNIVFIILICSLQFLFNLSYSQSDLIDSLKLALKNAKHDTSRCNTLSHLANLASDEEWPKFNEQLKNIAEENLRTITKSQVESIEFKNKNQKDGLFNNRS